MSFEIDTGSTDGGSRGPWISFKPKGSAKHGLPYKSWTLRTKTETGSTVARFPNMENPGVVLDMYAKGGQLCGTLKLGFSKSDGQTGVAPERRWFASPLKAEARPDETKKAQGGYAWANALSVRCAINKNEAYTWEDDGWGVYKGFADLVKLLNAGFAANEGLCPMVRVTSYIDSGSGQNTTSHPVFEVVKWVPRPECLQEAAPVIAAEAPAAPQPAPVAPPPPADVPADIAF
jgi:hypothetical protein